MIVVIYTDDEAETLTFLDVDGALGFLVEAGREDDTAALLNWTGDGCEPIRDGKLARCFAEYKAHAAEEDRELR